MATQREKEEEKLNDDGSSNDGCLAELGRKSALVLIVIIILILL